MPSGAPMRGVAEFYYCSVTAHGTAIGYVFPTLTLIAMGFGYAITEASLTRPLTGLKWPWAGWIGSRSARSRL